MGRLSTYSSKWSQIALKLKLSDVELDVLATYADYTLSDLPKLLPHSRMNLVD